MIAVAPWEILATISGALIALGVIGKSVHWVYGWANRVDESLGYVRKELSFNGGSSMRDIQGRMDARQERMEHRLAAIERHQTVVADELVVFRRKVDPAVSAVQRDVSTLLDHDEERDVAGARYGDKTEPTT